MCENGIGRKAEGWKTDCVKELCVCVWKFVCVCGTVLCEIGVCVKQLCVCDDVVGDQVVCGGGRGRRECTTEKQEPDTMMWEKS